MPKTGRYLLRACYKINSLLLVPNLGQIEELLYNVSIVMNKIKTVHNCKSKCREKTMTYCKNAYKIKVTSLKHYSVPKKP